MRERGRGTNRNEWELHERKTTRPDLHDWIMAKQYLQELGLERRTEEMDTKKEFRNGMKLLMIYA